jgi:hypothetical protein
MGCETKSSPFIRPWGIDSHCSSGLPIMSCPWRRRLIVMFLQEPFLEEGQPLSTPEKHLREGSPLDNALVSLFWWMDLNRKRKSSLLIHIVCVHWEKWKRLKHSDTKMLSSMRLKMYARKWGGSSLGCWLFFHCYSDKRCFPKWTVFFWTY